MDEQGSERRGFSFSERWKEMTKFEKIGLVATLVIGSLMIASGIKMILVSAG